jgi:hypothetical protein
MKQSTEQIKQKSPTTNPQVIYIWNAPLRAYKKKSGSVLRFYIALALLLTLIVILFGDKILIMPIWATFFLAYVLTITPSTRVINKITRFGIEHADNIWRWEYLSFFYFTKKFDYNLLVIVTNPPYSERLYLVVENPQSKNELIRILSEYIIYKEKPDKTITDKMAEWLTYLMPDETIDKTESLVKNQSTAVSPSRG